MKKLIVFSVLFFVSVSLHAQTSPSVISYQGIIQTLDGTPVRDSTYPVTIVMWRDSAGGTPLWQDVFQTEVKSGIFNILLGSQTPLPASSAMDHPLWISVSVSEVSEAYQRSRLAAVPMALNVADSSITGAKMGTDYISSVSVNGEKITSRGANLDIVGSNGLMVAFERDSNRLILSGSASNGQPAPTPNSSVYWSESGNNSTVPGTNYVGTSDSVALEIHVNHGGDTTDGNGRVMRYEPMPESPNLIGGYHGNSVGSSVNGGNVVAGGGYETFPNSIGGDFGTIGGGFGNLAGTEGTVAGGNNNVALDNGTVAGGSVNGANVDAFVGGGDNNGANSYWSTIAGGESNTIAGTIGGSLDHYGYWSAIGGGQGNYINGTSSAIPGGQLLTIGAYSFGFNGDSSIAGTNVALRSHIAYFGNVNLMIGNVDSVARQLQFFGPNTDHGYGSGAKYTAFRAPVMDSNVLYTLPKAQGDTNTVLMNDGTGNLRWDDGSGIHGSWSITGNYRTHPPTNFLGTLDSNSFELHIFDTGSITYGSKRVMRYELNDTSANILGGYHDNAIIPLDTSTHHHIVGIVIAGGGANGHQNTVKGSYAVVSGGRDNIDTVYSFVGGGDSNRAMGAYSVVGGGFGNIVNGLGGVIAGGSNDTIDAPKSGNPTYYNAILGGFGNHVRRETGVGEPPTEYSSIAGGFRNGVHETGAFVGGGQFNYVDEEYSSILGGNGNTVNGLASVISGGGGNFIDTFANSDVIAGGSANAIARGHSFNGPLNSTIGGGQDDTIYENSVGGVEGAAIPGGRYLIDSSYAQTVVGEYNIPQGNSGRVSYDSVTRNPNDRMFIVGGGRDLVFINSDSAFVDSAIRFNPFEVTRRGSSIVYLNNGSGGATPPPPGPPSPPNGAVYGARSQDNTCYAWADFTGDGIFKTCPVHSDFGVDSIIYKGKGDYRVYLNTVDPYSGSQVNFGNGFSVTATSVVIYAGTTNSVVEVTPLNSGGIGSNAFEIYVVTPYPEASVDGRVMFHVFGRE